MVRNSALAFLFVLMSCGTALADTFAFPCERTDTDLDFIQKEAERGEVQAQLELGKLYKQGACFHEPDNDKRAFEWIEKAADQGFVDARLELASSYMQGQGVEKDPKEALEIYHKLAQENSSVAQYQLGDLYISGNEDNTLPPDMTKALFWYETAANQGMIQAMNRLGSLYGDENRELYDLDISSSWFRKAAESGDIFAMLELAKNLLKSNLDENKQEATKWYHNAAELGAAKAQVELARSYAKGRGIERDYEEAYLWDRIAKVGGISDPDLEREITAELTAAQILDVEKRAKEYRLLHPPGKVAVKE